MRKGLEITNSLRHFVEFLLKILKNYAIRQMVDAC